MTLASAFHYNDRLCCTVDVVGISNFVSFFERDFPLPSRSAARGVR